MWNRFQSSTEIVDSASRRTTTRLSQLCAGKIPTHANSRLNQRTLVATIRTSLSVTARLAPVSYLSSSCLLMHSNGYVAVACQSWQAPTCAHARTRVPAAAEARPTHERPPNGAASQRNFKRARHARTFRARQRVAGDWRPGFGTAQPRAASNTKGDARRIAQQTPMPR